MDNDLEKALYLRVIKLAAKYPEGFKYSDITNNKELILKPWETKIIQKHFEDACIRHRAGNNTIGETMFLFVDGSENLYQSDQNRYILNFDTQFTFIDYLELKSARENAKEAKKLAIVAIVISIIGLLIQLVI